MNLDPAEIAGLLPFEERYDLRRKRWLDGPHESWEAFDRVLERDVVVNRPWLYTDVPRFVKTAKIAASLLHPCFLPVYDLGIVEGKTPYYTTAPVRGKPLSVLLRTSKAKQPQSRDPALSGRSSGPCVTPARRWSTLMVGACWPARTT